MDAAEIIYIDFHINFEHENIGKPNIYKLKKERSCQKA